MPRTVTLTSPVPSLRGKYDDHHPLAGNHGIAVTIFRDAGKNLQRAGNSESIESA